MKYKFLVEGDNKEDLQKLMDKMERSKLFTEASSGMAIHNIEEVKQPSA